jgi:eukaryotic-like serine/threonine-protein kinase
MTSERWQQIDQLFHAALACEPAERGNFLLNACGDDESLRLEVESLISSHHEAQSFIETAAGDVAAELLGQHESTFDPGQQIQNYKIVRQLGSGGMGEVYLADDSRLNRKIALKFLPAHFMVNPDRVRRFEREARAASALNHPNIVTIYEIGQSDSMHFIATEFVDGKTLRQQINEEPFTLSEALNVAIQVASALIGAHAAGIVHRDIKPENIMVRTDGYVKILDFGLAKLTELQTTDSETETPTLLQSNPGLVMGTVQYMSPEQARGKNVGVRTDIWSLGIVLYELLTGRVPFSGETPSHVMVSLMEDELPPLTVHANVPAELDRIVTKALRKNQKDRYQTAKELAHDLKNLKQELQLEASLKGSLEVVPSSKVRATGAQASSLAKASATETVPLQSTRPTTTAEYVVHEIKRHKTLSIGLLILLISTIGLTRFFLNRSRSNLTGARVKSVAVLPLTPINTTKRDEIYEVGIADSLIHRLSSTKGLVVRPLNATRKYAMLEQDPIAAGWEQQVDYVLASNYEVADGKVRVTAQLVNVVDGQIEETYQSSERDSSNVFLMEDAIADEIGKRLLARFGTTSTSATAKRETTNKEAYLLYLQGKSLMGQRSLNDMTKAIEYFEQAIQLDPNYARPYAGMAHAHVNASVLGGGRLARAEVEKVKGMMNKAFELDSNLAEAYAARADFTLKYEWDFPAVEKDLLRALELEPNNDMAHWLYALLSAYRGNLDKAMEEIETAQSIDPSALMYKRDRGRILYYSHRYDEAIVQLKRVIELNENFGTAYSWLWQAHELKGDYADAYRVFIKQVDPDRVAIYQKAYEIGGWQGVRRKQLEFDKIDSQNSPVFFDAAALCSLLGEKDQAFEYLNKAVEEHEWAVIMLNVEPTLDSLRSDPRFAELVRRVGLNR